MLHWILTALSTALAATTLACAIVAYRSAAALVRERARIRRLEEQMGVQADVDARTAESIARLNGRYGALRADLKRIDDRFSAAVFGTRRGVGLNPTDIEDELLDNDAETERREAERETLRQKLAAKVNH